MQTLNTRNRPRSTMAAVASLALLLAGGVVAGCSDYRDSQGAGNTPAYRDDRASAAMDRFRSTDPTLRRFFDESHAYAIFPEIIKGAAGIGAANGNGVVYERGVMVGTAEVTQVTIGAQLGGQNFAQIIFFEDPATFDVFRRGNMEFAANASAVAARSGAGASSDFDQGVAVFTLPKEGLMFEASIGGQKFRYRPMR